MLKLAESLGSPETIRDAIPAINTTPLALPKLDQSINQSTVHHQTDDRLNSGDRKMYSCDRKLRSAELTNDDLKDGLRILALQVVFYFLKVI